jgi:hypothetical protein
MKKPGAMAGLPGRDCCRAVFSANTCRPGSVSPASANTLRPGGNFGPLFDRQSGIVGDEHRTANTAVPEMWKSDDVYPDDHLAWRKDHEDLYVFTMRVESHH